MERSPSNHSVSYSPPFYSILLWDELDLYGRPLGLVGPRPNLPPRPLTQITPERCHHVGNHMTYLGIMARQAAIASLIEVRISTNLSGERTSNCSNDPWSYDEIFTGQENHF